MNNADDYINRAIIAPAAIIGAVRDLACFFESTGGQGFLPRGMSPTGFPPATHYGADGSVGAEFAGVLPLTHVDAETGEVTRDAVDPAPLAAMAEAAGAEVSTEQIAAILSACDVSEVSLEASMERLGIKLIERINLNTASAETLQRIPGVGKAMANTIIAARPIAGLANMDALSGAGPILMKTLTEWSTT